MLCMDEKLHEDDVLMIFDDLKEQTPICKSRSREDDFSSKFRCRRATDNDFPTRVTCHGQQRTWTRTKQTNSYSSSSSFSDLELSNEMHVRYVDEWVERELVKPVLATG